MTAPPDNWGEVIEDAAEPWISFDDLPSPAAPAGTGPPADEAQPQSRPTAWTIPSEDFFDVEPEPFGRYRKVQQLGILGGKGVGKSYLFQAMVYRAQHAQRAGALSYFLDNAGIELVKTANPEERARTVNLQRFNAEYERWTRLPTTLAAHQPWYRLTLPYHIGLLGRSRAALEVEFFDGSGEQFFEAQDPRQRGLWAQAYREARVLAFCLPLWAVFPAADLSIAARRERDAIIASFHDVVQNYKDMRRHLKLRAPVRTILALTMADDRRCALTTLRDTWIAGYLQRPEAFLAQTRTGRGVARYLANARRVSRLLLDAFAAARSPGIAGIPNLLRFGACRPWLIPVSAIHGDALDALERDYPNPDDRPARLPPVPVHVELPLLVALCEHENALM
jgi:hypothetical protein